MIPALTGDLLPVGTASATVRVTFQFEGGRHVAEFPAYVAELLDKKQETYKAGAAGFLQALERAKKGGAV